ncbi:TPA: hypothetical protein UN269_000276 [Stenotrophomonas maltophilia]|nr:hypothetical protein [Stenotrophomonas maltophilia]
MEEPEKLDLYCCLSSLQVGDQAFDLGHGLSIAPGYTRVMSRSMVAVERPAAPGRHHPGPWAATGNGFAFDSEAVLFIPAGYRRAKSDSGAVARYIAGLLRLWVDPRIRWTLASHIPPHRIQCAPEKERVHVASAVEVQPWYFELHPATERDTLKDLEWIRDHWEAAIDLAESSASFSLALDAIFNVQLVHSSALGLVSVWGALEALFTGANSELRFRVSVMIAAYLKPPGPERIAQHKRVMKLYDARSAAAHGSPKHSSEDLLASLELLRKVIIRMIESRRVPTKEELESLLFGE